MSGHRRVLALAPYPPLAPSTRYRLVQLVAPLESRGVRMTVRTFLDDEARAALGRGGWSAAAALLGRAREFRETVASAAGYDAVLVQRGLSPLLDRWFLRGLRESGRPLLYDFDDAVYLPQEGGRGWLERIRRPRATTAAFCRSASVVLPGNEHLAAFAREVRGPSGGGGAPGGAVRVLPSVVDTTRFRPPAGGRTGGTPTLGWVGSDSSLAYLEALAPALRDLQARLPSRLLVVAGARRPHLPGVDYTFERWRPEDEVRYFQELDVGLYPLDDTPWSRGKCGFKAIQYLACGAPCVAAPVGVLREIVRPGDTGFHATSPEEWTEACTGLLGDAAARRRMGAAGRALVEEAYSTEVAVATLGDALEGALDTG